MVAPIHLGMAPLFYDVGAPYEVRLRHMSLKEHYNGVKSMEASHQMTGTKASPQTDLDEPTGSLGYLLEVQRNAVRMKTGKIR
ncbi:hypothetical protein NDU88_004860 [Pleurodeles waltl]|uniref:Uncharacterized protein n=1 Tax=Pleurodeles waltl TaxID=8319 RepID=A0AAV7W6F3_PLEWA|nr:hypothetical protein NDU88_004860 [Pleurodeles waltl]